MEGEARQASGRTNGAGRRLRRRKSVRGITIIHIISNDRSNSCYESVNSCYDQPESHDLRLLTVDQMSNTAYLAARNPRPGPEPGRIEAGLELRSREIGFAGFLSP